MIEVITIDTPSLGDRSYLATDGTVAVVVDPQRDLDRVMKLIEERGLEVTHVFETHVHNDYVTGGYALARQLGAAYVLSADDEVAFDRTGARDGDRFQAGAMAVTALHTPGHTPTHLSYALADADGRHLGVFTGGSLLYGTVGRPDLISPEMTESLARSQFRSAKRLAKLLPDDAAIHPTHGFGSHCSAVQATKPSSTIGGERGDNPALVHGDEDAFVRELISSLTPHPTYYAHMAPINRQGPDPFDPTPPVPVDLDALVNALDEGTWVLDLRNRKLYSRSHLVGTINAELRDDLANYVGWFVPFGTALILIGETSEEIAEAQRMLARIGYDRLRGQALAGELAWDGHDRERSLKLARFTELAATDADARVVLDVRDGWEWESGHHPDAVHIPFHELRDRLDEVPRDRPVWVYCATGARATFAVSLLEQAGIDAVLVDDFCLPGDVPGVDAQAVSA